MSKNESAPVWGPYAKVQTLTFVPPSWRGDAAVLTLTVAPTSDNTTVAIGNEARQVSHDAVLTSIRAAWAAHPARTYLVDAQECLRGGQVERSRLQEEAQQLEHALQLVVTDTSATKIGGKIGQLQRQLNGKRQELSDCNAGLAALRQREAEARESAKAVLTDLAKTHRYSAAQSIDNDARTLLRSMLDAIAGDLKRLAILNLAASTGLPAETTLRREVLDLLDELPAVEPAEPVGDLLAATA